MELGLESKAMCESRARLGVVLDCAKCKRRAQLGELGRRWLIQARREYEIQLGDIVGRCA